MTPELRERLEEQARWHEKQAFIDRGINGGIGEIYHFHRQCAADLRAVLVSIDDEMRNRLVHQMIKAERRKYDAKPATPSAFGEL